MSDYVNWVEAEHAGDFESLDDALREAVVTAHSRDADVIVVDERSGTEWFVQRPLLVK